MGWIRSKPVYAPLARIVGAARHVFVSQGEAGARAVGRALPIAGPFLHLHVGAGDSPAASAAVILTDEEFLFPRLRDELRASPAGTALLLAGPERFIWECARRARDLGLARERLFAELAGSAARPVSCVHCKAITPTVTTSTVVCAGCGQTLFVRDHFSRRLAAYAGVRVDAEVPGETPAPEVLYA